MDKEKNRKFHREFELPKKTPGLWHYHPFELSISGYSGSGKTTLIEGLIPLFNEKKLTVSYFKHDAHKFLLDKEGKDTYRGYHAGASRVVIRDHHHHGVITRGDIDQVGMEQQFIMDDLLLIEGNKTSTLPKILMLDPGGEALSLLRCGEISNVIALVGSPSSLEKAPGGYEMFNRDNHRGIAEYILEYYRKQIPPLKGLLLLGGKSRRMGKDKAALSYSGRTQSIRALEVLQTQCSTVGISLRDGQVLEPELSGYIADNFIELITDRFLGLGPLGGICSAMTLYPTHSFLVIGIDMPFLQEKELEYLLNERNPFKFATAFGVNHDKERTPLDYLLPEPLCAIYEPKSRNRMLGLLARGVCCPRGFLRESPIKMIKTPDPYTTFNVNTPEDFSEALREIEARRLDENTNS